MINQLSGVLNIVIPMGGLGSRFTKEQYRFPKPLIRICGREMLLWIFDNLAFQKGDIIWLALSPDLDEQFLISNRMKKEYPKLDIRTVHLQFQTQGAAETLYSLLQGMGPAELSRRTVSLDCDTIYFSDILTPLRKLLPNEGASYYFEDNSGRPIFSFLKLDDDGQVTDIEEKVIISTHANTGAYAFSSAKVMRDYCARRLDSDVGDLGEYYTSSVIKEMIDDGHTFRGMYVKDWVCVGTPRQLRDFLLALRDKKKGNFGSIRSISGGEIEPKKQRFCFDLDGTLVTFPEAASDYTSVLPIESNIKLARELHAAGHTIIIQTARRMKTHGGNVAAVFADIGKLTINSLEKFGIPYDELVFGKPYADVYVDDNAIHAQMNTFKEIGWLRDDFVDGREGFWENKTSMVEQQSEMINPRSFNTIIEVGDSIFKSGPKEIIKGEVYFYENVPEDLRHLFPQKLLTPLNVDVSPESSSFGIELIPGHTFSLLLMGKCVTRGRLLAVLKALYVLHSYEFEEDDAGEESEDTSMVYLNYALKVRSRYTAHAAFYEKLGEKAARNYHIIHNYLLGYETNDRACRANIIHGDPVFTNVLLTKKNTIKFIDMRGVLGDTCTLKGDAVYDLGKVYQTLTGYDFLLHQGELTESDNTFLRELRGEFWDFVSKNYPSVRHNDVKMVTASLYFSLIPLHDAGKKSVFFDQCHKIIEAV